MALIVGHFPSDLLRCTSVPRVDCLDCADLNSCQKCRRKFEIQFPVALVSHRTTTQINVQVLATGSILDSKRTRRRKSQIEKKLDEIGGKMETSPTNYLV